MSQSGRTTALPIPWLLALLPPAYLVAQITRFAVDVPFADHWEFLSLLAKDSISFGDLWAQHNEHRFFVPYLVMLPLARVTGWNTNYELVVSLVATLGSFALVLRRLSTSGLLEASRGWALPGLSLIMFSMAQQENWLWGFSMPIPLNLLAVVGGTFLLTAPRPGAQHVVGAAVLAFAALFSFANGLAFVVLGGVALWFAPRAASWVRRALVGWTLAAIVIGASFLVGYHGPESRASVASFADPLAYLGYVANYLGTPLANFSPHLAIVVGLGGLLVQSYFLFALRRPDLVRVLPFLILGAYGVAGALATAIGRAGAGGDQAMASRYVSFAQLLWISVGACALAAFDSRTRSTTRRATRIVAAVALAGVVTGAMAATVHGTTQAAARSRYLSQCRELLLRHRQLGPHERRQLDSLHPTPGLVLDNAALLERLELSTFRAQRRR